MLQEVWAYFMYREKKFMNPILGQISCVALEDKFKECKRNEVLQKSYKHKQCLELEYTYKQCYEHTTEEFNSWVIKQFQETSKLIKFLRTRNSAVVEPFLNNSWAIFTNPENILNFKKYKKEHINDLDFLPLAPEPAPPKQ